MLKKILNVRLVQSRLSAISKPFQTTGIYQKSVGRFSDSNEPPKDPEQPQSSGKFIDSERKGKKDRDNKGKHSQNKDQEKKNFSPQILEPNKQKGGHQKGKSFGQKDAEQANKDKEPEWRAKETPAGEQKQGKAPRERQFFQFGARKTKRVEETEEEITPQNTDEGFSDRKTKIWRQDQDRDLDLETDVNAREASADKEQSMPWRGKEGDKKRQKGLRIFGKKDFDSGYVLSKLGIELQGEADRIPELTIENRNTILSRINSLRQLENTHKKYESLIELYIILEDYENAQQAYFEAQEQNKKNVVIENFMFEACLKDSYSKAHDFYLYMRESGRLNEILNTNMNAFIEAQIQNEHFEELDATLKELKIFNFNFGTLDISAFNDFFGFSGITDKSQINTEWSARKEFEFLRKSEIFVDYLREILRRKPSQVQNFSSLFKFKLFFGILNDLHYPRLKLDSNGLDISMNFLETLAESRLITPEFVAYEDLAKWMASYFALPESLRKIFDITRNIPPQAKFFPHFLSEFNKYIATQGEAPFDSQTVREFYAFLKEGLDKSKKTINTEILQIILEIAQAHKQYDIIFDAYENFNQLAKSNESPLFIYIYLTNAFTELKLSTKNCYQIVNNLIDEYSHQHNKFPEKLSTIIKTKALIRDGKYEEAHSLFNNEIFRSIIPEYQRTLLFSLLAGIFIPVEGLESRRARETASESLGKIKKFVSNLTENELNEIYTKTIDDTATIKELLQTSDIDSHIAAWNKMMKDPNARREQINEYRRRLQIEADKIIKERTDEYLIKKGKLIFIAEEETQIEHDLEAQKELLDSSAKEITVDVDSLNKKNIIKILGRLKSLRTDIKSLIKLPLETKTSNKSILVSASKEEHTKPLVDLVNDLIVWGVYNKEPLAVRLGEEFYDLTGYKMTQYLTGQVQLFYKYQLTGEVDREGSSFKYTQEHIRNIPKTFFDANSPYSVIEDDPVYDKFVGSLRNNPETKPVFERLVRQQHVFKENILKQDEACSNVKKPGKVNFVN